MEKRKYGKSGDALSVIGFGGICVSKEEPETAKSMVSEAVDRGINYFDVAPTYGDAEERLGPALEPYRNSVFLACKTTERSAEGAEKELHHSLKLFKTDHFDLYQLHSVTTFQDVQRILSPGGALEVFIKAREKGLIRHIGFSAHSEEAAIALMGQFGFDSMLFPLNWVNWLKGGFGPKAVEKAKEKSVSILALKTLAKRKWKEDEERTWTKTWYHPVDTYEEARLAVRFTLSLPITAAVTPGHIELLRWACDAADDLAPITEEETDKLKGWSSDLDPIFSASETRWE